MPTQTSIDIMQFEQEEIEHIQLTKAILRSRIYNFHTTICDNIDVPNVATGWFVSGGCIASLLQNEKPKDFDVYFKNSQMAQPVLDLFLTNPFYNEQIADIDENYRDVTPNVNGKCITENAISLKSGVQMITKHYGMPDEIRKTFDFVHCMPYYDPYSDKLYISKQQYICCTQKKLIRNMKHEIGQYDRSGKFIERGYTWL